MFDVPPHHPFRELRNRPDVTLVFTHLAKLFGGAFLARRGHRALLAIDPDLDSVDRNEACAHEIGHDIVGDDEERVKDFVARWLCPDEALAQLIASIVDDGRGVEAWEVAEAFGCSDYVALRALELRLRKVGREQVEGDFEVA